MRDCTSQPELGLAKPGRTPVNSRSPFELIVSSNTVAVRELVAGLAVGHLALSSDTADATQSHTRRGRAATTFSPA